MSAQASPKSDRRRIVQSMATTDEVVLAISDLRLDVSPRIIPIDLEHARMLAELDQALPPILVHAETMMVIDGHQRVFAAKLRGRTSIRAQLFEGTEEEAFILAVRANTTHCKPLSLAERVQAAARILAGTLRLSDRAIGEICGISPHTVAKRRRAAPACEQEHRVGKDGRIRPLCTELARHHAAALMAMFPGKSNRSIANDVGLSEGTVRLVRKETESGAAVNVGRSTRDNATTQPSDGHSVASAPKPVQLRCVRCASWLEEYLGSDAADLVASVPLAERPRVIIEALRIFERNSGLTGRR